MTCIGPSLPPIQRNRHPIKQPLPSNLLPPKITMGFASPRPTRVSGFLCQPFDKKPVLLLSCSLLWTRYLLSGTNLPQPRPRFNSFCWMPCSCGPAQLFPHAVLAPRSLGTAPRALVTSCGRVDIPAMRASPSSMPLLIHPPMSSLSPSCSFVSCQSVLLRGWDPVFSFCVSTERHVGPDT